MMRIFPFPPEIKFTHPYHNYYGSSFYQFMQLELLIRTSTSVFKHFLYINMPYICNVKIGCNFITLSFQHTPLQHFCHEIQQQHAGIQLVKPIKQATSSSISLLARSCGPRFASPISTACTGRRTPCSPSPAPSTLRSFNHRRCT